MGVPKQYSIAVGEIGVCEYKGPGSNPKVEAYLATVGLSDDATPWCAAYVNWCLEQAGLKGTGAANARSYEKWGVEVPLSQAQKGDVVVFTRGGSSWQGHVAFFDGLGQDQDGDRDSDRVWVVGGNQSDMVCRASFPVSSVITVRRPKTVGDSKTVAAGTGAIVTKTVEVAVDPLTHVVNSPFTTEIADKAADGADKLQSLIPAVPNDTLKAILATISVCLTLFIIYERLRRLWDNGD